MYRSTGRWTDARIWLMLPFLLVGTAAAPQDSEITYVKRLPAHTAPDLKHPRESRIENIPLTIPGNISRPIRDIDSENHQKNFEGSNEEVQQDRKNFERSNTEVVRLTRSEKLKSADSVGGSQEADVIRLTRIEEQNFENSQEENIRLTRSGVEEKELKSNENIDESESEARSVTTNAYETETTETPDPVTERVRETLGVAQTVDYETRTKAPTPRFLSKLSYFQKQESDDVRSSIATNFVERPGRRRFRSKCRCEKIWNCPKLQITVPRCPNEYFMCCF